MNELEKSIWTEKYRPHKFEDLIFEHKDTICKFLEKAEAIPSFIFYSSRPGTGKTSTAKLISEYLGCDTLILNSSDERGIDTIRDKIKMFVESVSSKENMKRMVFCDEADGLTRQALDSLRNLMETYSNNCFFIFSCNDLGKIIEPIRSRCVLINFEKPNKEAILDRLEHICLKEDLIYDMEDLSSMLNLYYPDIRTMVLQLQLSKVNNNATLVNYERFNAILGAIVKKDVDYIRNLVYSNDLDVLAFNKWFFRYLVDNSQKIEFGKLSKICLYLANTELQWSQGVTLDIVFLANIFQVMEIINFKIFVDK